MANWSTNCGGHGVLRAGGGGGSSSACSGTTKLVLHAQQAMGQAEALQFCRSTHGAGAYLPAQGGPVLDAAHALVQAAGVSAAAGLPHGFGWTGLHWGWI